ncbi:hypothetical protein Q7689_16515 [Nocardiopsis tropica]|uniref:hypothetical protein n=1 Tax=Nocardiopsis tropica TaxID=109330 RepID=UPI002E894C5D|nr:hypothetical protein [Nocardiopsis tropica]
MKTDLDALLTALYVHLDDGVIPSANRPRLLTDAERVCVATAQVLLRHDCEQHWRRAVPAWVGHLLPRLHSRRAWGSLHLQHR